VLELRADLDARNIAQLREQNKELEDALKAERACSEKHAVALMGIQRTCDNAMRACDNKVDELKAQHATAIIAKETAFTKLEHVAVTSEASLVDLRAKNAALTAENAALKAANAHLEAQVAVLEAHATLKLADIHAAIVALRTPQSPPRPVPSLATVAFDRAWCTAACGTTWKVDVDAATGMRARVTHKNGGGYLTLRSTAPLPYRPLVVAAAGQPKQDQLPACRVFVDAFSDKYQWCRLGFLPSHHVPAGDSAADATAVTPIVGGSITDLGGWYIGLYPSKAGYLSGGWTALEPSDGAYATTSKVPLVPAGGAVEFALDYAAGTCRVAFYTPVAASGGFVEMPQAKMELRFVATERPARPVPTLADSGVLLYPAATTYDAGAVWRFAC
jgi:hypothetical protein